MSSEILIPNSGALTEGMTCLFGFVDDVICQGGMNQYFFGLAELFTAIGLLGIFYRFRSVEWGIRLASNKKKLLLANSLLVIAIVFSFLNVLSQQWPIQWPLQIASSLLQLISLLGLSSGIVIYGYIAIKKGVFTQNNRNQYVGYLYRQLEQSDERIPDIISVLHSDINEIVAQAKLEYDRHVELDSTKDGAIWIINSLLSDPKIIKYLSANRAKFLVDLLKAFHAQKLDPIIYKSLIESIFKEMLSNGESHLHRQNIPGGLSFAFPVLDTIFGFDGFFAKKLDLLSLSYRLRPQNLTSIPSNNFIKQYMEVVLKALVSELNHPSYIQRHTYKLDDMGWFFSFVRRLVVIANGNEVGDEGAALDALFEISHFLGMSLPDALKESLQDRDIEALFEQKHDKYYPKNVPAIYVDMLLSFWQSLAQLHDESMMRHLALSSSRPILRGHGYNFSKLKEKFFEVLLHKTKHNVERGLYPNITKTAFYILAWREDEPLRNSYIDYILTTLGPKLASQEKMGNDKLMEKVLLPQRIIFDPTDHTFQYYDNGDNLTVIQGTPIDSSDAE